MFEANENYLKLPGNYLFSEIAVRIQSYSAANPQKAERIVRLGIGDVTQPLAPAIVKALHTAVDEMADARIAVCDPVYPVYVDSNVMAGRTGTYNKDTGL